MTSCHGLTKFSRELFLALHTDATPTSSFLRWFPGPASKTRQGATTEVLTMFCTYVETHQRHAEPTSASDTPFQTESHPGSDFGKRASYGLNQSWPWVSEFPEYLRLHVPSDAIPKSTPNTSGPFSSSSLMLVSAIGEAPAA